MADFETVTPSACGVRQWYVLTTRTAGPWPEEDLHFELHEVLLGVGSVTIHYQGARGPAAEVFHFGPDGKVVRAYAHYA